VEGITLMMALDGADSPPDGGSFLCAVMNMPLFEVHSPHGRSFQNVEGLP
jgi:hypothetical protein